MKSLLKREKLTDKIQRSREAEKVVLQKAKKETVRR